MEVDKLFREFSGKEVDILVPGGNRGDGLIYLGARRLLDRYNVKYKEFQSPEEVSGKVLFVYGCGGYCKFFCSMPKRIAPYLDRFEKIYILPSSFDCDHKPVLDFISTLKENVYVFCRERYSYEQVLKHIPHKDNVFLDKDTAFHADYSAYTDKGEGVLRAFRKDHEGKGRGLDTEKDISLGPHYECEIMREIVSRYEEVHTDRAHVSITAAMMGKKTFIYPNNYHKLKGIYEYSLSHLPNVIWKE